MSERAPTVAATGHKNRSIKRLHLDLRNPRLGRPAVDTEAEAMARLPRVTTPPDRLRAGARHHDHSSWPAPSTYHREPPTR